jgi:hypothetical protein
MWDVDTGKLALFDKSIFSGVSEGAGFPNIKRGAADDCYLTDFAMSHMTSTASNNREISTSNLRGGTSARRAGPPLRMCMNSVGDSRLRVVDDFGRKLYIFDIATSRANRDRSDHYGELR